MSDLFTITNSSEETIAIIRGSGQVKEISEPNRGAVLIAVEDGETNEIYSAWALEDDPLTALAAAALEDEIGVDFRLEVLPKSPGQDILLTFNDATATKRIFSMLDDIVSEKSTSDPENDFEAIEENSFTREDIQERVNNSRPAVKEGAYGELFNSERGPNYGSGAMIAATSADMTTRDLLLAAGIVSYKDFYTPAGEEIIDQHAKAMLQAANAVQVRLYDKRPGSKVDMGANSHSRIRGVILDTLRKGIIVEDGAEPRRHLWDVDNSQVDIDITQRLIDIVYSRMRHLGRLIIDPEISDVNELFNIFN